MDVIAKYQDPSLSALLFKYACSGELCFKKGSMVIMYSQHVPSRFRLLIYSFPRQKHRCLIGGCAAVYAVAV